MAASDYLIQGQGAICSAVTLASNIGEGTTLISVDLNGSTMNITPAAGMNLMINGEFCVLSGFVDGRWQITRGCADTIPSPHNAGSMVWFFQNAIGSDYKEYLSGDTLGVKVLMRTSTRTMDVAASPPWTLAMSQRFARPYAPGKVFVGDKRFYQNDIRLDSTNPILDITWAHRDRIVQGDQLIDHEADSIGPEPGTTYTIRVRKADGTLVRTVAGITGTSLAYSIADAMTDFALVPGAVGDVSGFVTLQSVRDGLVSRRFYRMNFMLNASAVGGGWGNAWGIRWGN